MISTHQSSKPRGFPGFPSSLIGRCFLCPHLLLPATLRTPKVKSLKSGYLRRLSSRFHQGCVFCISEIFRTFSTFWQATMLRSGVDITLKGLLCLFSIWNCENHLNKTSVFFGCIQKTQWLHIARQHPTGPASPCPAFKKELGWSKRKNGRFNAS